MSHITERVKGAMCRALRSYGDAITIVDRNNREYETRAIARRATFVETLDSVTSEYYFILSTDEFERIKGEIGEVTPPPFFGKEVIKHKGNTYVLRKTEPYEYFDGEQQSVRIWGSKIK